MTFLIATNCVTFGESCQARYSPITMPHMESNFTHLYSAVCKSELNILSLPSTCLSNTYVTGLRCSVGTKILPVFFYLQDTTTFMLKAIPLVVFCHSVKEQTPTLRIVKSFWSWNTQNSFNTGYTKSTSFYGPA